MPILIISTLVQLALIVHVLKTGRNVIWVFILLFAPVIGGVAYFIVELLPEITTSRTARQARRSVSKAINPDGDFRQAAKQLAVADTVQNSIALANQYLERAQFGEAKELMLRYGRGVHADDPVILMLLAQAQFGLREFDGVLATLDQLKASNPASRTADTHLLYARAHDELGHTDAAIHEYEALCNYYPGPEPRCRLAQILKARGDAERARTLFQQVVSESEIAGRHYNSLHTEWVSLAKKEARS
jgi:hypothetical protein